MQTWKTALKAPRAPQAFSHRLLWFAWPNRQGGLCFTCFCVCLGTGVSQHTFGGLQTWAWRTALLPEQTAPQPCLFLSWPRSQTKPFPSLVLMNSTDIFITSPALAEICLILPQVLQLSKCASCSVLEIHSIHSSLKCADYIIRFYRFHLYLAWSRLTCKFLILRNVLNSSLGNFPVL